MPTLRPCLHRGCSRLVTTGGRYGGYCGEHIAMHRRLNDERQTYAWQRLRAQAIEEQPWCSLCGATEHLVLDHVQRLADGGRMSEANTRVLCADCNGRRG